MRKNHQVVSSSCLLVSSFLDHKECWTISFFFFFSFFLRKMMGVWAHINGWIGCILSRNVWDVGYVYLCEHSEYRVSEWAHINEWIGRI